MARATTIPAFTGDDYRRRARRLRAVHERDPERLVAGLCRLAGQQDAIAPPPPTRQEIFAEQVRRRLSAGLLPFGRRQELLTLAQTLGIGRFDANLLIALVQHRCPVSPPSTPLPPRRSPWLPPLAAAAALQTLILAAAWWLIG